MNSYVKAFSAIKELKPKRVVILATSHYSGIHPDIYGESPFVISTKDFKMVNGTVTTDHTSIQKIKEHVEGTEEQYGVTFRDRAHRVEHSIEQHLIFLNHLWDHDFSMIPILVGGLDELFYKADGFQGQQVENFTGLLADLFAEDDDTFFLISGDLAHVGKKFGDEKPAKEMFEDVRNFDDSFLSHGASGSHQQLLDLMSEKYDPYRICGYPPLYSFLKTKPDLKGEVLTYDIWDESEKESGVSFGSIIYR
jgi:AmmeMemoRadiSam system protein B